MPYQLITTKIFSSFQVCLTFQIKTMELLITTANLFILRVNNTNLFYLRIETSYVSRLFLDSINDHIYINLIYHENHYLDEIIY